MRDFCQSSSLLPTRRDLVESGIEFDVRPELAPVFIGQASTVRAQDSAQMASPDMSKIITVLQDNLDKAFAGSTSTDDTLKAMSAGIKRATGARRRRRANRRLGTGQHRHPLSVVLDARRVYWMLVVAFSPRSELLSGALRLWPRTLTLENFQRIFETFPVLTWFSNSVAIAFTVAILTVGVNLLGGYALAQLRFRGATTIFLIALTTLMIPVQVTMVPLFELVADLNLTAATGRSSCLPRPTRSGCSCLGSSSWPFRETSSRRPASTAPGTCGCFAASCCRCRSRSLWCCSS